MKKLCAILVMGVMAPGGGRAAADNWPQWRGPAGNGVSAGEGLPTEWSESKNIVWKTALPSWSAGTPIVWGDRVFITSPSKTTPADTKAQKARDEARRANRGGGRGGFGGDRGGRGERRGFGGDRSRRGGFGGDRGGRGGFGGGRFGGGRREPGGESLMLVCLNKADGKVLWQKEIAQGNKTDMKHNKTTPSPVTDGKRVWTLTGSGVLAAFDFEGKKLWSRDIQKEYGEFSHQFGYASSPLLSGDTVVVQVLHDAGAYLLAVDQATGKNVWKVARKGDEGRGGQAYSSPMMLAQGGKSEIVVSGAGFVTGHDPATGQEIWRAGGLSAGGGPGDRGGFDRGGRGGDRPRRGGDRPRGDRAGRDGPRGPGGGRGGFGRGTQTKSSPTIAGGMIFAAGDRRPMLAITPGGKGTVTESHVAWKSDRGTEIPSPVSDGKHLYVLDGRGRVARLDVKTGENTWDPSARLPQGTYDSSLLLADGKLYATDNAGTTTVFAAGPEFKVLSENKLDADYVLGSLAASDGRLYLRGANHLYCIGTK